MVKRRDELRIAYEPNLKGGRGTIEVHNFFEAEDFYNKGRLYGISIIKPGESIGYHQHTGEQEAYFILEGEALYNDNGKEVILKPGDLSICKDGESHAIECFGDKTLKYIAFIMFTIIP